MVERRVPVIERFQSGNAGFVQSSSAVIVFPEAFAFAPRICVTMTGGDFQGRYWTENVSISGFTLRTSSVTSVGFQWFATDV